ncbi:MAG: copper-transporting P-type ATPase [Steroidobacteraceae bacterium]
MYACPMHPEYRRAEPGHCALCGCALESEVVAAEPGILPELADFQRRLAWSLPCVVALLALTMGPMWISGLAWLEHASWSGWLQWLLATPVVAWAGWPFLRRAISSFAVRLNMFTLIGLGVSVAYLYSVAALLIPGAFPPSARSEMGGIALYFEPAAVIVMLVLAGQVLELRARARTGDALRSLLDLAPAMALRIDEAGSESEVALTEVKAQDKLRVLPGARIPVDGLIIEGSSAVDESMVTGESIPVSRAAGDRLIGGTVNGNGSLVMWAERSGAQGTLARIVSLVAEAQRSRAPIHALADRVSAWFVPSIVLVAVVSSLVWWWIGPEPRLAHALVAGVTVLIIACPCAVGLATPMSMTVAMGRGARLGVLFREAAALEALARLDVLACDKTGTLTVGQPVVEAIWLTEGWQEGEVLRLAAGVARQSDHPLAKAVVRAARDRGVRPALAREVQSVAGGGTRGRCDTFEVTLGSAEFSGVGDAFGADADSARRSGASLVFCALNGQAAGVFVARDPLRAEAAAAVQKLRQLGLRLVMLTGDSQPAAQYVANTLGLDQVVAGLRPEQKAEAIRQLQVGGALVGMAGDGINDAPALAAADVGIAMGGGTDVAKQTAGVTLLTGDLSAIVRALLLARATLGNVRQNLWLAFGYNALGVPLAAGVLYPVLGWTLTPAFAALAMSLSSVTVIANALRLSRLRV